MAMRKRARELGGRPWGATRTIVRQTKKGAEAPSFSLRKGA